MLLPHFEEKTCRRIAPAWSPAAKPFASKWGILRLLPAIGIGFLVNASASPKVALPRLHLEALLIQLLFRLPHHISKLLPTTHTLETYILARA
jgi:hypothetical protein